MQYKIDNYEEVISITKLSGQWLDDQKSSVGVD